MVYNKAISSNKPSTYHSFTNIMKKTVFILYFLPLILGFTVENLKTTAPLLNGRIVEGWPIAIDVVPYQVSLAFYNYHLCGGSIISAQLILTAAHCIKWRFISLYSIRAGSSIRSLGIQVGAAEVYKHEKFNPASLDYDIAIILLQSHLGIQKGIEPVSLAPANVEIPDGTAAVVTGWGSMVENGTISTYLQAVSVPIVSRNVCKERYGAHKITENMICAGYSEGGRDSCQGDSGGPLIAHDYGQIGIVSWGYGCARAGSYGVYTNVPVLRKWITNITGI